MPSVSGARAGSSRYLIDLLKASPYDYFLVGAQ